MPGQTYTLKFVVEGKDNASKPIADTNKAMGGLEKGVTLAAGAWALFKSAQVAVDFVKLGAGIQSTTHRFEAFAGGTDKAAGYLAAFNKATDNTVPRLDAMAGASKMLQMDLVDNAAEMGTMAAIAVKLGDSTMSAGDRINDFSLLLSNTSIPRLDNFGISSAKVRKRIKELQDATKDLSREEAFKIAVMEQGRVSLEKLGDTSQSAATKIAQAEAALVDMKNSGAELAATIATDTGAIDAVSTSVKTANSLFSQSVIIVKKAIDGYKLAIPVFLGLQQSADGLGDTILNFVKAMATGQKGISEASVAYDAHLVKTRNVTQATKQYKEATSEALKLVAAGVSNIDNYGDSIEEMTSDLDIATDSTANFAKEQAALTHATNEAILDQGMAWTDYFSDRAKKRDDNVKEIKDIEAEHQANMIEIQKKGQSKSIHINAEAEEAKLSTLKQKLSLALLQQSEFGEKTKESTRVAKENQIAGLQSQIGTQSTLLDNYYNGRLVVQGKNVTAEIAAENARYAEEKGIAQTARAEQEEEMRLSLGRMHLQQFETWATIQGIPAAAMLEMKNQIATDYGLMTEEGQSQANLQILVWAAWEKNMSLSMEEAAASIGIVIDKAGIMSQAIENIPTSKKIDIEINVRKTGYGGTLGGESAEAAAAAVAGTQYAGGTAAGEGGSAFERTTDASGGLGGAAGRGFATGTPNAPPGLAWVGENGPELVNFRGGERVFSSQESRDITNNFNMTVNTRATSASVQNDYGIMESMNPNR